MQVHDRAVVHGQYSTECVGHVSFFCFCSFLCVVYVCDYGVDLGPYGQLWGLISFFLFSGFHFCLSLSSSGDVAGLLGTFPRCDHIDKALVGARGYRSKVMGCVQHLLKLSQGYIRLQVGPLVGTFSAHTRIHTAGKLGLDVTSVPGSSLQLSYIHQVGDGRH